MDEHKNNELKFLLNGLYGEQFFSGMVQRGNKNIVVPMRNKHWGGNAYCPEEVGPQYIKESHGNKKEKARKRAKAFIDSKLVEILNKRLPSEAELRDSLEEFAKYRNLIGLEIPERGFVVMEPLSNGTGRYAKIQNGRIIDAIKMMMDRGLEMLALTITYDIKTHGENRYIAWQDYTFHIRHILKQLRRLYSISYVYVLESTLKGYPHAHIVIGIDKKYLWDCTTRGKRKVVTGGTVYKTIKDRLMSPVFHLERISGKNTMHYLAKYIRKEIDTPVFDLLKKKEPWTKAERKMVQTFLFTVCTHSRHIGFSRDLPKQETEEQKQKREVEALKAVKNEEYKKTALPQDLYKVRAMEEGAPERRAACARLRAYLIRLCTNSPCYLEKPMYFLSLSKEKWAEEQHPEEIPKTDDEKAAFVKKYGSCRQCKGCFFHDFVNFVNRSEKNIFDYFFDGVDMSDDEEYIDTLRYALRVIIDRMEYCEESYYEINRKFDKMFGELEK